MPEEGHAEVVIASEWRPDKMYPPKVSADTLGKTYQDEKTGEDCYLWEIYLIRKNIYRLFDNERWKDIDDIYGNQR